MIETIIQNFREFMLLKGWTQTVAADHLNISQAHLSRIFNGKRTPSMTLLRRMEKIVMEG